MSDLTSTIKEQLRESSDNYKEDINVALKAVGETLGKTGVNALVITGALVTSYLLYRGLAVGSSKKKKRKKEEEGEVVYEPQEPTMIEKMTDKVLEQSMLFLLTLAKEKLVDFLTETTKEDGDTSTAGEKA